MLPSALLEGIPPVNLFVRPGEAKDMQGPAQPSGVSRAATLCLARLGCAWGFCVWMFIEWLVWPNGSALLGPIGIVWYNGIGLDSFVLCTASWAMLFAFLCRPHVVTALISLVGAANWLFWGVMALGIGC